MAFSVNTNTGASIALQNLNSTQKGLEGVQTRINTGLAVSSAKDDSATFSIAQKLRGDMAGLKAVASSLSRAKSTVDVAVSGAESVSDLLVQMKGKAMAAADAGIDSETLSSLNKDFTSLRDQVTTAVNSASFNGTNLLDGSATGVVKALRSIQDGNSGTAGWQADELSIANQDLRLGTGTAAGTTIQFGASSDISTTANAVGMVTKLDDSIKNVNTVLGTLGSASRQVDSAISFNSKLSDTIESGIGNLVDADLAKESAKLQSLQIKQQLGLQALSIANQAPQSVMSLFR